MFKIPNISVSALLTMTQQTDTLNTSIIVVCEPWPFWTIFLLAFETFFNIW